MSIGPRIRHLHPSIPAPGPLASPLPPGEGSGVRGAARPAAPGSGPLESHPTGDAPHPGPLPGGEGDRRDQVPADLRRARSLVLGSASLTLLIAALASAELRPTPPFNGQGLHEPPKQKEPWTPPETGLPKFLVRATAALAEQGLADPRGCEYREVEFEGESKLYRNPAAPRPVTHAWVLPAGAGGGPRFAVAWNGLVYPLVKLGDPADLDADVPQLPKPADKDQPAGRRGRAYFGFGATTHLQSASQDGSEPIRASLLLRLGRADLAERAFAASTTWRPPGSARDLTSYGVSYLTLASNWTWALFDRAVAAHGLRDDRQALADARELARVRPLIEAKARSMGFPEQPSNGSAGYLAFLKPLPALLADQERRTRKPDRQPRELADLEKIADQPARIAALIDSLDETSGGGPFNGMAGSATIQAIAREGYPAVDPLLKALESDDRLTRATGGDDRHGTRTRDITPVSRLAYTALVQILGTSQFSPDSNLSYFYDDDPTKRRAVVGAIRAYAERFRGVPEAEKWYRILADDRSSPAQWVQAGGWIAARSVPAPPQARRPRSSPFGFTMPRVRYDEKVPRKGDPLRDKKTPSVSDLLARRVEILSRPDAYFTSMNSAKDLALDLALWDPEAARPTLSALALRCRDRVAGKLPERFGQQIASEAATLAQLTDARVQLGDPKALADYAEMLAHLKPKDLGHSPETIFGPMVDHPDDPAIIKAAETLFLDPASPWLPLLGGDKYPNAWIERERLIAGPFLGMAAFRTLLVRTLGDRSTMGTVRLDEKGSYSFRIRGGGSGGGGTTHVDLDGPKAPRENPIRDCDYLAWKLSETIDGLPRLMPFWPEDRRDRAIADQVAFLERYGERFDKSPLQDSIPGRFGPSRRTPAFPPLDRPATDDDVRRGLAIFSLDRRGPARVVPLSDRPLAAKWLTLEDSAYSQQSFDPKTGKSETKIIFDQDGLVWQAEEVEEGGRWRRYYGFVGRRLGPAPAEEIEFPEPWTPAGTLADKVDAQLIRNQGPPRTFVLRLRNRAGLPRAVPTAFVDGDRPALRPGVDLELSYTPTNLGPGMAQAIGAAEVKWEDLTPKSTARLAPDAATRTLEPAGSFDAFSLKVEDWFDVSRPGTYRLRVRFGADSGLGEGTSNEQIFPVPEPARPPGRGRSGGGTSGGSLPLGRPLLREAIRGGRIIFINNFLGLRVPLVALPSLEGAPGLAHRLDGGRVVLGPEGVEGGHRARGGVGVLEVVAEGEEAVDPRVVLVGLDRPEERPGLGRGQVVDGLGQPIELRLGRGVELQPFGSTGRGDRVAEALLLEPLVGEVEQDLGVVRRHRLEPSDRRADREPAEHVGRVVVGEEPDGGPAGVEEQPGGVGAAVERDERVALAVDDRQRDRPLRRLEGRVGVGRGLALENHLGGDRERAGDRLGAVHQEAVG